MTSDPSEDFFNAIYDNDLVYVKNFIDKNKDAFKMTNKYGNTPLHSFSFRDNEQMFKLMLESPGVDIEIKNRSSHTPLHHAARCELDKCVKLLIDAGANLNALDDESRTPLHLAAKYVNASTFQILVDHGADPDLEDIHGVSALKLYVEKNDKYGICRSVYFLNQWVKEYVVSEKRQALMMKKAAKLFTVFKVRHDNALRYTIPNIYIVGRTVVAACFPDLSKENLFTVMQKILGRFGVEDEVVAPEDRLDKILLSFDEK